MAGRIRTIKPDLLDQERFAQLSDAGVRLFTGCLALVDDAGVCPAGPTYLGGRIFYARPRSPISIGKLLAELERARLVDLFVVDRAHYLAIVGWTEKGAPTYQRIDKPQASKFPLPTSVRSWNGIDAGSDPIRSDPKGSEPARAIAGVPAEHAPPPPPNSVTPVAAPRHAIVPAVSPPAPRREDIARTQPQPQPQHLELVNELWAELEQARARAAAARGVAIRPLMAFDTGRGELAKSLREASNLAAHVDDVRHAIAAAEAEARIAPKVGERDQLQWFTGAIFSANNFRRLAAAPLQRAKPRRQPEREQPIAADQPLSAEDRAAIAELAAKVGAGRADVAAAGEVARGRAPSVATRSTAEIVRMFGPGPGERAPPAPADRDDDSDSDTDDNPDMESA